MLKAIYDLIDEEIISESSNIRFKTKRRNISAEHNE